MCTKDKRSTYIPIIPQKDFIQWQGQATHGLLHDSTEEMSERWVLRNSRSFTFYGNPTPTSHVMQYHVHLISWDQIWSWSLWDAQDLHGRCYLPSGVSDVMRQKAWEFSSLSSQWNVGSLHVFQLQWLWCFSWIRIPPPALQKWAPPPQSAAKSLRCILPQRLAKINIEQSFQFRCKNGLNNWLVQSLSHKCIYSITFYLKTTTKDQPKWAQSFGNEIESQGSQVSAFQP